MNMTEDEIYTSYCKNNYERWFDALQFKKEINETYHYQLYRFKIRFNEFIQAILNKFKDK